MIIPELAGSAVTELDGLRAACDAAVAGLAGCGADTLVVVGADQVSAVYRQPFHGSFRPWGAPVDVTLDPAGGPVVGRAGSADPDAVGDPLPLSLLVGGWLLRRAFRPAAAVRIKMETVSWDDLTTPGLRAGHRGGDPDSPLRVDADQGGAGHSGAGQGGADDPPWALLVMGDGSACRGRRAPGYDDPRAQAYDDGVAAALAGADTEALLALDPALSARLRVAGRAPWQVLAAAARQTGGRWRGDLSYYSAPYGVAYFVATWMPA